MQYGSGGYRLWLSIQPTQRDTECSFVYLQLVKGDSTDLSAEFVTSVTAMDIVGDSDASDIAFSCHICVPPKLQVFYKLIVEV